MGGDACDPFAGRPRDGAGRVDRAAATSPVSAAACRGRRCEEAQPPSIMNDDAAAGLAGHDVDAAAQPLP
jgi:hypothetical protein